MLMGRAGTLDQMDERRVNGGGLPETGRAGEQNQSARLAPRSLMNVCSVSLRSRGLPRSKLRLLWIEMRMTIVVLRARLENGDAEFDAAEFGPLAGAWLPAANRFDRKSGWP